MRLIARQEEFNDIGIDQLVLLPEKPPTKVRNQRERITNLTLLDGLFVPFSDSRNNCAPTPPDGMRLGPDAGLGPSTENLDLFLDNDLDDDIPGIDQTDD